MDYTWLTSFDQKGNKVDWYYSPSGADLYLACGQSYIEASCGKASSLLA